MSDTPHITNEKTELVGRSCITTALIFLSAVALTEIAAGTFILMKTGFGILPVASLILFAVVFVLLLRSFWRSMATAYIRGEMIVVKYLNGDVRITESKHLKISTSRRFLSFSFSFLKFRIDGKQHRVLLFGNSLSRQRVDELRKAA